MAVHSEKIFGKFWYIAVSFVISQTNNRRIIF